MNYAKGQLMVLRDFTGNDALRRKVASYFQLSEDEVTLADAPAPRFAGCAIWLVNVTSPRNVQLEYDNDLDFISRETPA